MKMLTIARPRTSTHKASPWHALLWTILLLASPLAHSGVWFDKTAMFKYGAVYARSIVLNENGNPTYVEYDGEGREVTGYQLEITDANRKYTVVSGDAYRATQEQYTKLEAQNKQGELLTREQYLNRSFQTVDGTPLAKPTLNANTLSVFVRPALQLVFNNPEKIILAQYPINVLQNIEPTTKSLIMAPDGTIKHKTYLFSYPQGIASQHERWAVILSDFHQLS